jgi:hypothetical protein
MRLPQDVMIVLDGVVFVSEVAEWGVDQTQLLLHVLLLVLFEMKDLTMAVTSLLLLFLLQLLLFLLFLLGLCRCMLLECLFDYGWKVTR